jgi:hypothetical protein
LKEYARGRRFSTPPRGFQAVLGVIREWVMNSNHEADDRESEALWRFAWVGVALAGMVAFSYWLNMP